jgi:hypothetical protein
MRAFWRLLQHSHRYVFRLETLSQTLGPHLLEVLKLENVLVPVGTGGPHGPGTERVSNGGNDDNHMRLSVPDLVALVRRTLRIEGVPLAIPGLGSPREVPAVGTLPLGDAVAEVFLVLQPTSDSAVWFMAARRLMPVKTLLLMPTAEGLPSPLLNLRENGGDVQLRFLDEAMCLHEGHIVMAPGSVTRRAITSPGPFCNVSDPDGTRQITRPEALALKAMAKTMELFIDTTTSVEGGLYRAYASLDGSSWFEDLPWSQATALIELGTARRPMRVSDFTWVDVDDRGKLVERARREVDVELKWRCWRAFKTLPGEFPKDKRFFFDPPAGFRYAFLYF